MIRTAVLTAALALASVAHADPADQLEEQLAQKPVYVAAYQAGEVAQAGKIAGTVTLAGAAPELPPIKRTKDLGVCGPNAPDPTLVLGAKNGVANAVVTVEAAAGKKLPKPAPATLDQKGCTYAPHVQAVALNTPLTIQNSDPVLHNVHAYRDDVSDFNEAEPLQGQKKTVTLKKPGLFKVRCDVHGWMSAWIYVSENPYFAVTDADGKFSIDGLPPGTYTVNVWHERLAPTKTQVTVMANGTAKADVALAAAAPK